MPLYKVEEMCERCAASWHAVMAASLLDSVIIGQQFMGGASQNRLEAHYLHVEHSSNGASVHGKKVRARAGTSAKRKPSRAAPKAADDADKFGGIGIVPHASGKYSAEERTRLVARYQSLTRSEKSAFNQHYKIKAWQMRDWAK